MKVSDFQLFCSTMEHRPALQEPFTFEIAGEQCLVATDGRVMIAMPTCDVEDYSGFKRTVDAAPPPMVEKLFYGPFSENLDAEHFTTELPEKTTQNCDACNGTGRQECRACFVEHDCDYCESTGKIHSFATESVFAFDREWDPEFIHRINNLKDVCWFRFPNDTQEPAPFRFAETGFGLVQPLREGGQK